MSFFLKKRVNLKRNVCIISFILKKKHKIALPYSSFYLNNKNVKSVS